MDAVIYHPVKLADLLAFILRDHAPDTLLIICSDRQSFMTHLKASHADTAQDTSAEGDGQGSSLLPQTLRSIQLSRSMRVAFCASVPALHAYLTALPPRPSTEETERRARPGLVLIDPLALHKSSGSLSAQTLSQSFAMAVEASLDSDRKVVVVETTDQPTSAAGEGDVDMLDVHDDTAEQGGQGDSTMTGHDEAQMWDEEIPILSSSSKAHGVQDDASWLTRKVKVSLVAARYFDFKELP